MGSGKTSLIILYFAVIVIVSTMVNSQNCRFKMDMGFKYDKCSAICQGRKYKCIADDTCLCQSCPDGLNYGDVHIHEDVTCDFTQQCTHKCMEVNSEPEYVGKLGRGKMCEFVDDYYGTKGSVCACTCI